MGSMQNKEILWSSIKQRAELGREHSGKKENPRSVGRDHPEVQTHLRSPKRQVRGAADRARKRKTALHRGGRALSRGPGGRGPDARLPLNPVSRLQRSLGSASIPAPLSLPEPRALPPELPGISLGWCPLSLGSLRTRRGGQPLTAAPPQAQGGQMPILPPGWWMGTGASPASTPPQDTAMSRQAPAP